MPGPVFKVRKIKKSEASREGSGFVEIYQDRTDDKFRWKDVNNDAHSIVASSFGNTYFVSPDGNDEEAEKGNIVDTFKTISAARDKAAEDGFSDSLVYVFPGTYRETMLTYGNDDAPGRMYLSPGVVIEPYPTVNGWDAAMAAVDQEARTFTFEGQYAEHINEQLRLNQFRVGGGANAGIYTAVNATQDDASTTIQVREQIPSSNIAGSKLQTSMSIFPIGSESNPYSVINTKYSSTNFSLYGQGVIIQTESLDGDWLAAPIDSIGGKMFIEFERLESGKGTIVWQSGGELVLQAKEIIMNEDGYCMTLREDPITTVRVNRLVSNNGYAFFIRPLSDSGGNFYTGQCTINCGSIETTGAVSAIAMARVGDGALISIECPLIKVGEQYAAQVIRQSGGRILINGDIISESTGGGLFSWLSWGGELTHHGSIYLKGGGVFRGIALGAGNSGTHTVNFNGDIEITDGVATPGAGAEVSTGTLRMNGSIENNTGAASGIGVRITGAGEFIADTLKIVCDNSDSILADPSQARDININHSIAANNDFSGDITNIGVGAKLVGANVK